MKTILSFIGVITLAALFIFAAAVLSGTILFFIYPHIFAMFPNAATSGVLASTLEWWDAVCVTWIFGILIKGAGSNSSSSDKK